MFKYMCGVFSECKYLNADITEVFLFAFCRDKPYATIYSDLQNFMDLKERNMSVYYQPNDKLPIFRTTIYAFQWLAFNLVNVAVVPLVVGTALGLDQHGTAALAQRTMLVMSLAMLLQVFFGHRLPIIEGPAGMWWAVFITLASMSPGLGKSLAVLRTDLELGVMTAGVVLVVLGLTGLMQQVLKLFTPVVTGTVLVLLVLQLSGSFITGMLGISGSGDVIDPRAALVSILVVAVVILISLTGRGFIRTIAILIGTGIGWLAAVLLGLTAEAQQGSYPLVHIPSLFAWGRPTFDPGVVLVSVVTGVLVLSNQVASILAMERTLGDRLKSNTYTRGVMFTGIGDILAGLGAAVGMVSYSGSAGLVSITGVAARAPFILFAVVMMIMGMLPPVAVFLTNIPLPVGYSVLLASFCQILGFGLQDYARLKMTGRDFFVIGLPIILCAGLKSVPASAFNGVPDLLRYVVANGFISGMLLCLLLEHILLPKQN